MIANLFDRTGLPEDLRFLVEKYPRVQWPGHANLGEMSKFWLQRHEMFRELGATLDTLIADIREGRSEAGDFAGAFVPRLRFFLQQLHAHHQVEDEQYFPLFRRMEPDLRRGFAILDQDHETIHEALGRLAESANIFLPLLDAERDRLLPALDNYADQSEHLLKGLQRHLTDEEDLIIPVALEHGERKVLGS